MHYFKRHWAERRGDAHTDWGTSVWYFETESDLVVIRQIEFYANGTVLHYDREHAADEFGRLADQPLNAKDFEQFAIERREFEETWVSRKPFNRPEMEWHQCLPLPVFVRFHYISPTGAHPLTPLGIRERYLREVRNSTLVVWRVAVMGRFGIRAGIDEFACRTDDLGEFELGYARPAKGSGSIWLCTSKETIFSTDRFSADLLVWFRQFAAVLNQMFQDAVVEKDCGYDA